MDPVTEQGGPYPFVSCGVPVNPSIDFAFFPSQVLADTVGGQFPVPPFLPDGALGHRQNCCDLARGEHLVGAAERSRSRSACAARRLLDGVPVRHAACSSRCPSRWLCTRVYVQTRARGRDGTIGGTITHGRSCGAPCGAATGHGTGTCRTRRPSRRPVRRTRTPVVRCGTRSTCVPPSSPPVNAR